MSVLYRQKKIIPAPLVNISRDYRLTEGKVPIGPVYSITLVGKLVADKGSPNSDGTFHTASGYPADETLTYDEKLMSILRKQEALRNLFSTDGGLLEIQPEDASAPLKCNVRVLRVGIPQGQWHNVADYEISLEAESVQGLSTESGDNAGLERISEEWNIERIEDKQHIYRLTHSLQASGRRTYDETGTVVDEGWEKARTWVLSRLGINTTRMEAPGVLDLSGVAAYDYARVQRLDEAGGAFGVVETWIVWDGGSAREEFTINVNTSEEGRSRVRIEGTIQGLETRHNTTYALVATRWTNANTKWTAVYPLLYSRCTTQSGLTLHTSPLNQSVGYNETSGVITYSFEYDDRPTFVVAGAISESVTVSESNNADVFATIPVLGRAVGPVLQSIGTVTPKQRTIQIEVQLPAARQGYTPSQPSTTDIILSNYPPAGSYTQLFITQDVVTWNAYRGSYSRSFGMTYQ